VKTSLSIPIKLARIGRQQGFENNTSSTPHSVIFMLYTICSGIYLRPHRQVHPMIVPPKYVKPHGGHVMILYKTATIPQLLHQVPIRPHVILSFLSNARVDFLHLRDRIPLDPSRTIFSQAVVCDLLPCQLRRLNDLQCKAHAYVPADVAM